MTAGAVGVRRAPLAIAETIEDVLTQISARRVVEVKTELVVQEVGSRPNLAVPAVRAFLVATQAIFRHVKLGRDSSIHEADQLRHADSPGLVGIPTAVVACGLDRMALREMLEPFIREAAAARVFVDDAHQVKTAGIQIVEEVFEAAHREDGVAVRWSLAVKQEGF